MNIVILAAGQGKRMRSALPKVLHPIAGRPMLAHVIDTARAVAADLGQGARIVVVVGHGAEQVQAAFAGGGPVAGASVQQGVVQQADPAGLSVDLRFVRQVPQQGTGHAVRMAAPELDDSAATLVLYGDVPLVRPATLRRLVQAAREVGTAGTAGKEGKAGTAGEGARSCGVAVGVLTVVLGDPTGYGRVVRDPAGGVSRIVEHRDANEAERRIAEVNTGILVAPTAQLKRWLAGLTTHNAQGEYYLTDVIAMAVGEGVPVVGVVAPHDETQGVNSKVQLAELERLAQRRSAEALMEAGVRLADPARIDIRGTVTCDGEAFVDVNCVFEGVVHLGAGVTIGPNCVVRDAVIGAQAVLAGFCLLDGVQVPGGTRVDPFTRRAAGA